MNRQLLDGETAARLGDVRESIELCDPRGRVLGVFLPAIDRTKYEGLAPPFSDEELRRAEDEEGGRSLEDILHDLEGQS